MARVPAGWSSVAVPSVVQTVVDDYLGLVDARAPGLVRGLYLVGSVALDDFRPHASDIDFVAVADDPLSLDDIDTLREVHAALAARHRRPYFDGGYVTWRDLSGDPALARPGADAHEGRLNPRPAGRCDPVAWHTLARHGVTMSGPRREDVTVWTDRAALSAWTRRNLDDYWRPWLRRSSRLWSWHGMACVHDWGPAWGVLGVSRLHYTLATGAITSKHGAGVYARDTFEPRWRRIVDECLRLRRGRQRQADAHPGDTSRYRSRLRRRRDALDFRALAIDDAHRIP
jgi:hypothetical protein